MTEDAAAKTANVVNPPTRPSEDVESDLFSNAMQQGYIQYATGINSDMLRRAERELQRQLKAKTPRRGVEGQGLEQTVSQEELSARHPDCISTD